MNILIPDSWLKDFLDTKATPKQIADALSLHSASVENIEKAGKDFIYNIEITTNRTDMASVYGIAREAATALSNFGINAKLKPYSTKPLQKKNNDYLNASITIKNLCPRFSTVLCRVVENLESPDWIKKRLNKSGISSHNIIIDITNYIMLEIGQPMHAFDYDKLKAQNSKRKTATKKPKYMLLRESKSGETITTLDGVKRELPGGDIIIEDGAGRLIDLCGIKGGENSAIDNNTKNVLLFTQKYDPARIRKTIQKTGLRTDASTLFEKGTDPELTVIALEHAFELLKKYAGAKLIGGLLDIYPNPYKPKKIKLDINLIKKIAGVDISKLEITKILESLGFLVSPITHNTLLITVPSWRSGDILIPQDLVEEVVRIYGYHNLLSNIPPFSKLPNEPDTHPTSFLYEIKQFLKHQGFSETYTYSLIPENFLAEYGLDSSQSIKIANPLTRDTEYLRPSLVPSLLDVLRKNQDRVESLKIFEIAKTYNPSNRKNALPKEILTLTLATNALDILELKKILELLLKYLGISKYRFVQSEGQNLSAQIKVKDTFVGTIARVHGQTNIVEVNLIKLLKFAKKFKKYNPISEFPPLIEDMTFSFPPKTYIGPVIEKIKSKSRLIKKVEILDQYKNNFTFRITYQSSKKSLSSSDIKDIRKKIGKVIEKKHRAKLKAQEGR
jgi:phenylalanyl-tRNA synthetase beta chain